MTQKNILKDFDLKEVRGVEKKKIVLSVRITQDDFNWIKENRISATKFFNYFLHKVKKQNNKVKVTKE